MDQRTNQILFALLRSAIDGKPFADEERASYSSEMLSDLLKCSSKHDVVHLLVLGLQQNGLIGGENAKLEQVIFKAVYRYEQLKYEFANACKTLEAAQIAFVPLKGSVLRRYYPEPWMRTSCDIDILVHREDLEQAIRTLVDELHYEEKERATHDVSLFSPTGTHVELHFDLVEEGRANSAIDVLSSVWEDVTLCKGSAYQYEMSDAFFYFYHIAHMVKHFEEGGCGIRPLIDLWILDHLDSADRAKRDALLSRGGLLKFANVSRNLSAVWFGGAVADDVSMQMQEFLLHGGVYGSTDNRVALKQSKKGGRMGYILSRIFIPYAKLKRYYPILEKHKWLMPVMQVRRWFMLLNPKVAKMAKSEMAANGKMESEKADQMSVFLDHIGL